MEIQDYSPAESTSRSAKWVSDDDIISRYTFNGMLWGAVGGIALSFSADLSCRFLKNSQGCGASSVADALGFYALMAFLGCVMGWLSGKEIGKEHPRFRRLSILCAPPYFFLLFGWPEVVNWWQPQLSRTFWSKPFILWSIAALTIFYAAGRFRINQQLKRNL